MEIGFHDISTVFKKVDACYQAVKQDDRDVLSKNFEKEFISYKDNCGRGLLSTAAFYSSVDCVTFLLSKGYDPCEFNHKGTTALMFAKTYNRKKDIQQTIRTVQLLKESGSDLLQKDMYGASIFDYLHAMEHPNF